MRIYTTKEQNIIAQISVLRLHIPQVCIYTKTRQRHMLTLHVVGLNKLFLLDFIQQYETVKQSEAHVTMKTIEPCILT